MKIAYINNERYALLLSQRVTGLDDGDAALMSLNLWIKEHLSKFDLNKLLLRPSFAPAPSL